MNTPRLRVGLVGAGWVTQHHLPAWQAHADRAEVVAIADPSEPAARARAAAFGIGAVFPGAREMLDALAIDVLDVAAPREAHVAIVDCAAERGVAVLCQKPLAPTLAEAMALARRVEGRTRLMVHENWRFRRYYRDIWAALIAGRIGRPRQVHMELFTSGMIVDAAGERPALARQPFMRDLDRMLVSEVLIHHLDTLRFLLGELRVVHARLERSTTDIRGEDVGGIFLVGQDGMPVSLLANLAEPGRSPALVDRLEIVGTAGSIALDGDTLTVAGALREQRRYDMADCYRQSYVAVIGHFLDCLASGAAFETGPQDNLRTLALVEEIYRIAGPRG